jgi:predicted dinucleotide-binding enzyme
MRYPASEEGARPPGTSGCKAITSAGDGENDLVAVAALVDALGLDPVVAGSLTGRADAARRRHEVTHHERDLLAR